MTLNTLGSNLRRVIVPSPSSPPILQPCEIGEYRSKTTSEMPERCRVIDLVFRRVIESSFDEPAGTNDRNQSVKVTEQRGIEDMVGYVPVNDPPSCIGDWCTSGRGPDQLSFERLFQGWRRQTGWEHRERL